MRVSIPSLIAASVLAAVAALPVAADDLTIVSRRTRGDNPPTTTTSYLASDKMRMSSGDANEFIADYATGNMTIVDNKKKEYYTVTKQDMEAVAAQMQAQMKQMQAQMQNLPPEVREKMAGAMGGAMGGVAESVSVQKGTGGKTIAGYACENWIVTIGELSKQETCLTTQIQMPVAAFDAQKNFASSMSAMAGPMAKSMGSVWDKFKEMKGIPLYSTDTVKILGKTTTTTMEVTEIKKGPIPASAFAVPAGYKQVESPMAKALKKQK
jgi:hypothetical protein